jgi:hypothetical protein
MNNKNRWNMFVLAAVVLLGIVAVLLLIDVNLNRFETNLNTQSRTLSANAQEFFPLNGVQGLRGVALYIPGEDRLSIELQQVLPELLQAEAGMLLEISQVWTDPPSQGGREPLMVVEITGQELFWTPVYARGAVTAAVEIASDGKIYSQVIDMDDDTAAVMRLNATHTGNMTAVGFTTLPAYYRQTAEALAANIATQLYQALNHEMLRTHSTQNQ